MNKIIPRLHLEISSKCALSCPLCPRTEYLGHYKITNLPLESISNIVQGGARFGEILLCGDHGDPIYHDRFHDVIRILLDLPGAPSISLATNGSHRSIDWWLETASLLRPQDNIVFGIDGLRNTSGIYRRGIDWDSSIAAIKTLKSNCPSTIVWQWILFKFNEHQLHDAAMLMRDLKIDIFILVESSRYEKTDSWCPTLTLSEANQIFKNAYDLSAL